MYRQYGSAFYYQCQEWGKEEIQRVDLPKGYERNIKDFFDHWPCHF